MKHLPVPDNSSQGFHTLGYKKLKNRILFYCNDQLFAAIVKNRFNEIIAVSATKQPTGVWYSFALADVDEIKLGLSGLTYSQEQSRVEEIYNQLATA